MKTEKLIAALRCSSSASSVELDCRACTFHCARYAEEIAVLREKVNA